MALEAELLELMTDEVTIEPYVSQNTYSEGSFGPPATWRARVEPSSRRFFAAEYAQSVERVATSRVYITGAPRVSVKDRITLPDGSQPRILGVDFVGDERGPHHQCVWT